MKLFYDDEFDALQQMVASSERELKECAIHLWPDMKPESAYAKFKACINPAGDERFKPGQVVALMNFCQRYDWLAWACQETLHAPPVRVAPEDEEASLVSVVSEAAETMRKAMAQIERLQPKKAARR